ncbi:MAG: hypothetical protein KY429_09570 [Actinobacteria bacterium]|nr:hypothetical protein [Actinomycetota bacterium]
MSRSGDGPAGEDNDERAASRGKKLEKEESEPVADPEAQAEQMLKESDKRTSEAMERDEDDDTIERRTSEEASGAGEIAEQ